MEGQPDGGVAVAEAMLKPNELTQPDTTHHSLTRVPFRENVDQRQRSQCSGDQWLLSGS